MAGGRLRKRRRRRLGPVRSDPTINRVARELLAFSVIGSVLAIGSVHVPVLMIVACVAVPAGVLTLWADSREQSGIPAPALVFAALAVYTVLQAIPMPLPWLAHLDPVTAAVWRRSSTLVREAAPRVGTLSLDPGASWVEALKWCTYSAIFTAAASAGRRRGVRWGAVLLLVSATLVALMTIAHGAAGATTVYGIYEPRAGGERWHIGPLLNPNNLAGYLNLATLGGLGLLAAESPPAPRWVISFAVATTLAASILSSSRGGVGTLLVGLVLLSILLRRLRRSASDGRALRRIVPSVLGAVVAGIVLALVAADQQTLDALLQKDIEKIKLLAWMVPMLRDHPWFGVGRGAFQSVFAHYFVGQDDVIFTHPENFLAQWTTEWGLPVGVIGLGTVAWLFRPSRMGSPDDPVGRALFVGLIVLIAQNLVDLSLEVPGVAIAAATAAGFLWGERAPVRREPRPPPLAVDGSRRLFRSIRSRTHRDGGNARSPNAGFGSRRRAHRRTREAQGPGHLRELPRAATRRHRATSGGPVLPSHDGGHFLARSPGKSAAVDRAGARAGPHERADQLSSRGLPCQARAS